MAFDLANEASNDIDKPTDPEMLDRKIALAQVFATLSVSQELSGMIEDKGLRVQIEESSEPRSGKTW
jgi:hypothetical protein